LYTSIFHTLEQDFYQYKDFKGTKMTQGTEEVDKLATGPDERFIWPPREPPSTEEQEIIRVVREYVEYSNLPLASVINTLRGSIEDAYTNGEYEIDSNNNPELFLWTLYNGIIRYSRTLFWTDDKAQRRLVDILQGLKSLPDPPRSTSAGRNFLDHWEFPSLWKDAVVFGASAREELNESPGIRQWTGEAGGEVLEWNNFNAFLARLTAFRVHDFSLYGFWTMRDTLEDEPEEVSTPWVGDKLDVFLPAAAIWILLAGEVLLELDRKMDDSSLNKYSVGRWQIWKSKFRLLASSEDLSSELREWSEKAAQHMVNLEADGNL
jgi:hypothetical protein